MKPTSIEKVRFFWDLLVTKNLISDVRFAGLSVAYKMPARKFHNENHILDCLNQADELLLLIENGDGDEKYKISQNQVRLMMLAILYHDIIYDINQNNNEFLSACRAVEEIRTLTELEQLKISTDLKGNHLQWVFDAIMATKSHKKTKDEVINYMLDIDMSILGSSWPKYKEYLLHIRQEYQKYDFNTFVAGRIQFINSLKSRKKNIYHTKSYKHLSKIAFANFAKELALYDNNIEKTEEDKNYLISLGKIK